MSTGDTGVYLAGALDRGTVADAIAYARAARDQGKRQLAHTWVRFARAVNRRRVRRFHACKT